METSLHRQLKEHYAGRTGKIEVQLDQYRIDVVKRGRLIEIQHGSLSAIRRKVRNLCEDHKVTVVKPLIARKFLIKRKAKDRQVIDRRLSPKKLGILDVFHELIYFRDVFPHPHLYLEIPMVHVEEWRFPGHGRRRRRRDSDFQVEDQKLVEIVKVHKFRRLRDLMRLIPKDLPKPFHTLDLAKAMKIDRSFAQRIAYCLREMKAFDIVGKQRNSLMYEITV